MRNKTESKILVILNQSGELTPSQIEKELENVGYCITYDTVWRNLKRMTEEEKVIKEAKGKPWKYHYRLNKSYKSK